MELELIVSQNGDGDFQTITEAVNAVPYHLHPDGRHHAKAAYLSCEMGAHIVPAGWDNWSNSENEKTARFIEYDSTGPGAGHTRAFGAKLSKQEAAQYRRLAEELRHTVLLHHLNSGVKKMLWLIYPIKKTRAARCTHRSETGSPFFLHHIKCCEKGQYSCTFQPYLTTTQKRSAKLQPYVFCCAAQCSCLLRRIHRTLKRRCR